MTDSDPVDLDTLFGYKDLPVGLGELKLRLRVMLTRKQVRVSAQLHQRMIEAHKNLTTVIDEATTAAAKGELVDLTEKGEQLEDELAAICIKGLQILCIDPPAEILEQMQISDLAGLFARANVEQGELAAQAIAGAAAHPTSASSAS